MADISRLNTRHSGSQALAPVPPSMARLLRLAHRHLAARVAFRAGRTGVAFAASLVALASLVTWLHVPLPREVTFAVALLSGGVCAAAIWYRARPDLRTAAHLVDVWAGQPDLARSALEAPRGGLAGAYLAQVEQVAARVLNAPPRAEVDHQASVWAVSALVLVLGFVLLPPMSVTPGPPRSEGNNTQPQHATKDTARPVPTLAEALFPVESPLVDTGETRAGAGRTSTAGGSGTTSDPQAQGQAGGRTEILQPAATGESIALPGHAFAADTTARAAPLSSEVIQLAPVSATAARPVATPVPLADLMPEQRRLIRRYQTLQ